MRSSPEEFTARLDATSLLSKTATFRSITSVEAELTQNGVEPPLLSTEAKSMLFTIADNALTNAFRHAEASRVLVVLDFGQDELRLSVSDEGVGLPDDYEELGHGFKNMRTYAERLGGRLIVEPRGPVGGASVTCVVRLDGRGQEG